MLRQRYTGQFNGKTESQVLDYHMGLHKLCRSRRILARYSPLALCQDSTILSVAAVMGLIYSLDMILFMFLGLLNVLFFTLNACVPGNLSERSILLNTMHLPYASSVFVMYNFLHMFLQTIIIVPGLPNSLFGVEGGFNELRDNPEEPGTKRWFPVVDTLNQFASLIIFLMIWTQFFDAFARHKIKIHRLPRYMLKVNDDYNIVFLIPIVSMFLIAGGNYISDTFKSPSLTSFYISTGFSSFEALCIIVIEAILYKLWFAEICKFEEEIDQTRGLGTITYSNNANNSENLNSVTPNSPRIVADTNTKVQAPFDNLNPYPCGIDRLSDKIVLWAPSQKRDSKFQNENTEAITPGGMTQLDLHNSRRDRWNEERKKIDDQNKAASKTKVQDKPEEDGPKSRLTVQAELNLMESSIGNYYIFHSIYVHALFELARLLTLLYTAKKLPKGAVVFLVSILVSSVSNCINRLGIPRLLIVALLPESDTKLGLINKFFFIPTAINKVHDTAKFGAGYCRFLFIGIIWILRAAYFDKEFDPYNELNYLSRYEDPDSPFSNVIEKDRLDPTQVHYDCFCWNGNCLNVFLAAIFLENIEDIVVEKCHNNKRLKMLSAAVLGYAYDQHLLKWQKKLPYNQADKLHHHRLFVKNTEGSITISNSSKPSTVPSASCFDSFVNLLESIISRSKFGREAIEMKGKYVPTPRCRHMRQYSSIRGGSLSMDMTMHALGAMVTGGMTSLPALTMGNAEFWVDRPTYSLMGSYKAQEMFFTVSRLHDDVVK